MPLKKTSRMGIPDISRRLRRVSSPEFKMRMARNLAEEARTQISDSFQRERDPYGKRWAPPKYRKGMALQDTGRMAASVATVANVNGFRIEIPVKYAAPHQYGAHIAPHSRLGRQVIWNNPKTGRFVKKSTKRKAVIETTVNRRTYAKGITIPRRQMVPMPSTGGLGPIWTPAFHRVAKKLFDEHFKGASP